MVGFSMTILKYIATIIFGYFMGSLSAAIILSKTIMKADVRTQGSGNAGATNMARAFGIGMGVITLAGDVLKTAVAIYVGWLLLGDWGMLAGGAACLVGHCFPALHEFRGGKGVSAGAAIFFAADWRILVGAVCCFIIGAVLSKKVSLGSVAAAVSGACIALILGVSTPRLILVVFTSILVLIRHRANIKRLLNGTEPDFKAGKAQKPATSAKPITRIPTPMKPEKN